MEGNILCTEFPSFPDSAELNSNAAPLRLFQDGVGDCHTRGTKLFPFKLVDSAF